MTQALGIPPCSPPTPGAGLAQYFGQLLSPARGRRQITQLVLPLCCSAKEAVTFPETQWPFGSAFESEEDPHP